MRLLLVDAVSLRNAARRTAAVRLVLSALVVGCLAGAYSLADRSDQARAAGPTYAGNVEIILDLSGSIAQDTYPRILRALRSTAARTRHIGLVTFSDTAEEVLPPGTPVSELRPVMRYFKPTKDGIYPPNPWALGFKGGTSISTGIAAARRALEREHMGGRVLLISDLADYMGDLKRLRRELLALARDPVTFRVAPLPGFAHPQAALYRRIFGAHLVQPTPAPPAVPRPSAGHPFPLWLVAVAATAAAALAARELLAVSLRWRAA